MGIVLAVWITTTRWKKLGGNFDQVLDITLVSVPAGIIGARLYHIITTPERFFGPDGDWAEMFRIWNGGLGIWGGVLFGALAAWAWCRHKHYPMALLADAIAPGLLVAQAVGRLGNWFNQELYGAPTTLPWGLKLNMEGTAIGHSEQCYDGATCPEWHAVPSDVLVRDDLEPHRRRDYRIHRFQSHEETQGRFPVCRVHHVVHPGTHLD